MTWRDKLASVSRNRAPPLAVHDPEEVPAPTDAIRHLRTLRA